VWIIGTQQSMGHKGKTKKTQETQTMVLPGAYESQLHINSLPHGAWSVS
jgi:hypothetical protein